MPAGARGGQPRRALTLGPGGSRMLAAHPGAFPSSTAGRVRGHAEPLAWRSGAPSRPEDNAGAACCAPTAGWGACGKGGSRILGRHRSLVQIRRDSTGTPATGLRRTNLAAELLRAHHPQWRRPVRDSSVHLGESPGRQLEDRRLVSGVGAQHCCARGKEGPTAQPGSDMGNVPTFLVIRRESAVADDRGIAQRDASSAFGGLSITGVNLEDSTTRNLRRCFRTTSSI